MLNEDDQTMMRASQNLCDTMDYIGSKQTTTYTSSVLFKIFKIQASYSECLHDHVAPL